MNLSFLSRLSYLIQGQRYRLALLMGLFLVSSSLESVGIGLIGPFIAVASQPEIIHSTMGISQAYSLLGFTSERNFLILFGLLIIFVILFKNGFVFLVQRQIFVFGYDQQNNLRSRLMNAYLRVPYPFHLKHNTSTLIHNVAGETSKFSHALLLPLVFSLSHLTVILALIALLAATNIFATLSVTGILLLVFLIVSLFKKRIAVWGQNGSKAESETIRIINHSLGGIKETRLFGCESYFEKQFSKASKQLSSSAANTQIFSSLPRYLLEVFIITFLISFVLISLVLSDNIQSAIATMSVFGFASFRLLPAASSVLGGYTSIKNNAHVVDKIYLDLLEVDKVNAVSSYSEIEYLHTRQQSHPQTRNSQKVSFNHEICLNGVTYYYPATSAAALTDVSLNVKKGESIGIVGKSGAGKTTLVDVILGLLEPQSGDIQVDNVSVLQNIRHWQNMIGYIPQSIFLIDDTIERNIALGIPDEEIDREKLNKSIKAAQLADLLADLPDGGETMVGERGVRLSGGQRQRIGIARALYYERDILVLDEATSALDNETENLVSQAISALSGDKTMIIIAHRLTTLRHCNRIYGMAKGRITKVESYCEMMEGADKETARSSVM
ncbi:MAG: ABC transporter ATP-binding protein [Cyanobacteria bacterium P01_D01_bin.105]